MVVHLDVELEDKAYAGSRGHHVNSDWMESFVEKTHIIFAIDGPSEAQNVLMSGVGDGEHSGHENRVRNWLCYSHKMLKHPRVKLVGYKTSYRYRGAHCALVLMMW